MNNLLSYCGLVDVRINASDKDLPVKIEISSSNKTIMESPMLAFIGSKEGFKIGCNKGKKDLFDFPQGIT